MLLIDIYRGGNYEFSITLYIYMVVSLIISRIPEEDDFFSLPDNYATPLRGQDESLGSNEEISLYAVDEETISYSTAFKVSIKCLGPIQSN